MLIGSFAFANTDVTSEIKNDVKQVKKVQNKKKLNSTFNSLHLKDLTFSSHFQFENLTGEEYPCRWRVCYYRNGVLIGCSAWTYGECLDEVIIK